MNLSVFDRQLLLVYVVVVGNSPQTLSTDMALTSEQIDDSEVITLLAVVQAVKGMSSSIVAAPAKLSWAALCSTSLIVGFTGRNLSS